MRAHHDIGGFPEGELDTSEHEPTLFDRRVDAMMQLVSGARARFFTTDASRRATEGLAPEEYRSYRYYEKWLAGIHTLMIEKGAVSQAEIDRKYEEIRARQPAVESMVATAKAAQAGGGATVHHDHSHAHDGYHPAEERYQPPAHAEILEQAMREIFIDKGYFTAAEVQAEIADLESRTPAQGARMVAHMWTDPEFRDTALRDGRAAAQSLAIDMSRSPVLTPVENTPTLHHVVVCTLCSCYPRPLLGIPPAWYKSLAYRSRTVIEPRSVLKEFGTVLAEDIDIRVVDSTADHRYIVVPVRPAGTDGWSAEQLETLVTRDSMIGVGLLLAP